MCEKMTTVLMMCLCNTSAFEALSLSHLIPFLSILPNNFYDLCPRMRKPKLCKCHMGCPQDQPASQEGLEPDLRSHDSHSVKGEMTCRLDSPAQGFQLAPTRGPLFPIRNYCDPAHEGVVILGFSQLGETQRRKMTKLHYKLEK